MVQKQQISGLNVKQFSVKIKHFTDQALKQKYQIQPIYKFLYILQLFYRPSDFI